jgi:hypothetical protein
MLSRLFLIVHALLTLTACAQPPAPAAPPAEAHSADVPLSWMALQLRLTRTTPGISSIGHSRLFACVGVALYEAVVPGMTGYRSLGGQLNGLPELPNPQPGAGYHWPASANAALSAAFRAVYPNTPPDNRRAIDSLETAYEQGFRKITSAEEIDRSVAFGRAVAQAVVAWAKTDGADNATPYTPPTGPGLWEPAPPAFGKAVEPNWGKNRPFVAANAAVDPGPPIPFSTDPGSPFYAAVKEIYDVSLTRTAEQTAIADFWNDLPDGKNYTSTGHWVSILAQVLRRENATLAIAAEAYAKVSMAFSDACVSSWKSKYKYNVMRPVTAVRQVLGHRDWLSHIPTPAHPEYSAAHATLSAAAATALANVFGENYAFTDHSYDHLGMKPRSYASFMDAAREAAVSRVYGGIHYRPSGEAGLHQGQEVGRNVVALKFRK